MTRVGLGRRALLWLSACLTVGVFVVPMLLVAVRGLSGESALVAASGSAFVRSGVTGAGVGAGELDELVGLWREFHLVKAGLAALLVLTLGTLAVELSGEARRAGEPPTRWSARAAYGGVLAWMLAALTIGLANLQGAVAPLASVASLLPTAHPSGEVAAVLAELREAVQVDPTSPAGVAGDLLDDFAWYHAAFAVLGAVAGVVLISLALRAGVDGWRRRGGAVGRGIWLWRLGLFGGAGAFYLLVAAANASTWLNPAPALVASLGGG